MSVRRWARDVTNRRYEVTDHVVTTKRSWFGPGIAGEVVSITADAVTIATSLTLRGRITVRHHHVLVTERQTGLVARARNLWRQASERNSE